MIKWQKGEGFVWKGRTVKVWVSDCGRFNIDRMAAKFGLRKYVYLLKDSKADYAINFVSKGEAEREANSRLSPLEHLGRAAE
jgi:hypothetical protein